MELAMYEDGATDTTSVAMQRAADNNVGASVISTLGAFGMMSVPSGSEAEADRLEDYHGSYSLF